MINIKTVRCIFLIIILFSSILFTTIVYSAFSTRLQINGEAILKADEEIRITDLKVSEMINNAYETYNSKFEKDTTHIYATLPANASIKYNVTITNKSDDKVYKIIKLQHELSNDNPNISINCSISEGDYIGKKSDKKFTITLSNTSSEEQIISLISKYEFEELTWSKLKIEFLSESNIGYLTTNEDEVTFRFSVTNENSFNVNYKIASDNPRFIFTDTTTENNEFQIAPNETIEHTVRITLREDVTYENYIENLDILIRPIYPPLGDMYAYTVQLHLPEYFKAVLLNDKEIQDSPESFTTIEDTNSYLLRIKEISEGLYTYFYRGVIENNYVIFADKLWRIIRVDSNGNIRVILNDNVETKSKFNSNYSSGNVTDIETAKTLVDYRNSNVRTAVETWYNQNILNHEDSKYVVESNFCIDMSYQGPIETEWGHTVYYFTPYIHVGVDTQNFTPDFTCATENIFKSHVGLLTAEEILAAGGYWQTPNNKFYLYNQELSSDIPQTSWTMSPSYFSQNESQAGTIAFNQAINGKVDSIFDWVEGGNLDQEYGYRPVISLNGNVKVIGTGTKNDPYILVNN